MESLDDLKQYWQTQPKSEVQPLNSTAIAQAINTGLKKERVKVREYVLLVGFWQWLVYAALYHFIIRFWGDWQFVTWCLGGILLYIPFTVVFMRKFKAFSSLTVSKPGAPTSDMYSNLKTQHYILASFYAFKQRFDWFMIPGISFIIVLILSQYKFTPPLQENITVHTILFLVTLLAFIAATYHENKKHFITPLRNLRTLILDIEKDLNS